MLVKRSFSYRFYPTESQAAELSRTFGCVRLVYNMALAARTTGWQEEQRRIGYAESSALLTGWKRSEDLAFLNIVSSVPLQQSLRHLQRAFTGFFDERTRYPPFQIPQEVQGVGGVHAVRVPLSRRATHVGEDDRALGDSLVASAPRGCGAVHGDGVEGSGRPVARVPAR